jgi:hypothetical protein
MAVLEESGDLRSIVCPDFALVFERAGDRWTHALAVSQTLDGPREIIARAIEWDMERDSHDRVVSPVFQELHFQTDPSGSVQGLLVGMSGKHHFSAVFHLEERATEVILSVDIADRTRELVAALASTYAVMLNSGDLADTDETTIAWNLGHGRLIFASEKPALAGLAEAGRRATQVQATIGGDPENATKRWQYTWIWMRPPAPH